MLEDIVSDKILIKCHALLPNRVEKSVRVYSFLQVRLKLLADIKILRLSKGIGRRYLLLNLLPKGKKFLHFSNRSISVSIIFALNVCLFGTYWGDPNQVPSFRIAIHRRGWIHKEELDLAQKINDNTKPSRSPEGL